MALYSIIQYLSVTLLYSVKTLHRFQKLVDPAWFVTDYLLWYFRFSATWETFSFSSLTSPSFSSLPLQVSRQASERFEFMGSGNVLTSQLSVFVLSESEPSVEGVGVASPTVQSDLRPTALLSSNPDPHLPGVPGPGFSLGTAAKLVRDMDASVRVSNVCVFTSSGVSVKIWITQWHVCYAALWRGR